MMKTSFKPQNNHREGNLIQVLILRTIYEKKSHGYEIIESVEKVTTGQRVKAGTAYTLLRRMEKRGLIKSVWEKNEKKPDKRVYTITREGKEYLNIRLEFFI